MKKTLLSIIAIAAVGTVIVAGSALADPVLILDDPSYGGSFDVIVGDGLLAGSNTYNYITTADDDNGVTGAVTYIGSVGDNWVVNVSTGLTKPVLGSAYNPVMDLASVNTSLDAGVLNIYFTDTDFLDMYIPGFQVEFGGTTDGTSQLTSYSDDWNWENYPQAYLTDSGILGPGAFASTEVASANINDSPYSLSMKWQIVHDGSGVTSGDAKLSAVPEPTTMLLFGTGLLGLAGVARRRRK